MQFLMLIYQNENGAAASSQVDPSAEYQKYMDFGKEFAAEIKGGNALEPTSTAKTVRVRDGKSLVTDGPYTETKEQLAGYYLIEAKDAQSAVAIGAKIPGARHGSVEVRPIRVFS